VHNKTHFSRTGLVLKLVVLLFFLLALKVVYIQFFRSAYLKNLSTRQHTLYLELEPKRGIIYDRNLTPLAVNIHYDSLYAAPQEIKDIDSAACRLSEVLDIDTKILYRKLDSKKFFVWLKRKLPSEKAAAIKRLDIKGLGFIKESRRSYPNLSMASNLFGFAGVDNVGLEGLELYYDQYLKGQSGWRQVLRDGRQNLVLNENIVNPIDGYNLVLNLDEAIQFVVEQQLDEVVSKYKPKAASVLVMDPYTGRILAWAVRPNYNLNNPGSFDFDQRRNRPITDILEPGSVFKIVTASAALEEGLFEEDNKIFCENGEYRMASHNFHDHKPHGWLTFEDVVVKSSNIGVSKIAQKLGEQKLYKYIKAFGFGNKTGIDLYGELPGLTKEPRFWSKFSIFSIPMGQEIGVTVLQLCRSISVIANGGYLVKPFLVSRIQDNKLEAIKVFKPEFITRVISEDTAKRMRKILQKVVDTGTGIMARLKDYSVGGKTGTAQKIGEDGKYSHKKFVASFVGFAPVENPKLAIAVVVDEPSPYYYGGVVSAPVFKKIADYSLRYLESKEKERLLVSNAVR